MNKPPIFLIGYMAAGKTTLGRALAKTMDRDFIDLDFYIEQRFHTRIPDIFATRGEDAFRRIESDMLREVGEMQDVIISCGGGTPCHAGNMDFMLKHGTVVFLDASVGRICQRVMLAPGKRPLLAEKTPEELEAYVRGHLAERLPHYRRAHLHLGADRLESREQIDETVAHLLTLLYF